MVVCGWKCAKHNFGLGGVWFLCLGCFSGCVGLCGVGFFAQLYVESMLTGCVVVVQLC